MSASYTAARMAEDRRTTMLEAGHSFATETVFSHPSKLAILETARARGYLVFVMYVGVNSTDLSVGRTRTDEGGHNVPEDKIRARYTRSLPLIRTATLQADRRMVFENSQLTVPPKQMLGVAKGRLILAAPALPQWILTTYQSDLQA